jgi:lipopolysaccharide export system ATP-binding protein
MAEGQRRPVMQPPAEGLTAHMLAKSYRNRPVVRNVSVSVRRGEAVGLLGPNGAGKTTVFYMITGLIAADKGSIRIDGEDITHLPMYQRARLGIGYLPQESSIFRGLTVEQNLRAVLEFMRRTRPSASVSCVSCMMSSQLPTSGIRRLLRSLAENVAGWKSPAPLPPSPSSCSSTSPSPGLIRLRSVIFASWCDSSPLGESGCLLRITTSEKPSNSSTRALIIHEGHVLTEGSPQQIVNDPDVRRYYLGESFSL